MKLGVLFSGGKDSHLALFRAMNYHEIACLITIESKNKESYMFHVPNINITEMQAKAMEKPIIKIPTKGIREMELEDLKKAIEMAIENYNIEGVVSGAIRSTYQASRIQKICDELNVWCFNPLWLEREEKIIEEIIKNSFEVVIAGVFAYPLTERFLGKKIDEKIFDELKKLKDKYNISLVGEGGEFETTVLDAPFYKKKIKIVESEIKYSNYSGVLNIKKAILVEK